MTSNSPQRRDQRSLGTREPSFVPMLPMRHFALSSLPPNSPSSNNNGIRTRFRPLAKLSTVSLVGRQDKAKPRNVHLSKKQEVFKIADNSSADIGLEECIQSRPPLKIDLSGPKPTTYDPPASFPWETTSPSYTMRPKTQPEKEGGGDRVAWNKQWIASHDIWTYRAHFDQRYPWPSPAHYTAKPTIGAKLSYLRQSPAHSMGKRRALVLNKIGSETEPAPNQYNYSKPKLKLMKTFPSYSVQEGRKGGTMVWTAREPVPGPGSYNPRCYRTSSKRCAPNFSMSRSVREIGLTRNCTF